jgi:hypothetical protein
MTKEYWDFLLSMRNTSTDPSVTESILFGMLVILEITDPRHVAEHFPKQVVETQAWVAGFSLCMWVDVKICFREWMKGREKCWPVEFC